MRRSFTAGLPPAPARRIPVHAGPGVLSRLYRDLGTRFSGRPVVVVADRRVARLHGAAVVRRIGRVAPSVRLLTFSAGEASKTRETKAALEDRLFAAKAGRDTVLVALGGGVTADLAGFLAATWHRGVTVLQVPTSVLAMVDAALGGKTAVDLPGGKNLVGAFHQPEGLYADTSLLATLPEVEYRTGLAEAVKLAAVSDAALFRRLERDAPAIRSRRPGAIEPVVAACLRVKARIVAADERDRGPRAALNFGHTVAHALEAASHWRLRHGEAVAIGLAVESRLAVERLGFPEAERRRLVDLSRAFGLPVSVPRRLDPRAVARFAGGDKKNAAGRIRCALPRRLGRMPEANPPLVEVEVRELLRVLVDSRGGQD